MKIFPVYAAPLSLGPSSVEKDDSLGRHARDGMVHERFGLGSVRMSDGGENRSEAKHDWLEPPEAIRPLKDVGSWSLR